MDDTQKFCEKPLQILDYPNKKKHQNDIESVFVMPVKKIGVWVLEPAQIHELETLCKGSPNLEDQPMAQ